MSVRAWPVSTSSRRSARLIGMALIRAWVFERKVAHIDIASEIRVWVAGDFPPYFVLLRLTVNVMADPSLLASFSMFEAIKGLTTVTLSWRDSVRAYYWSNTTVRAG